MRDENDNCSQANTLATLPSYVGNTEIGSEILPIPLSSHITPHAKDTLNLHAIMSAPVTATLPLMDFLRVKPELWEQVSRLLINKGYSIGKHFYPMKQAESVPESFLEKISLNKLNNHGKFKSENGHTTLPVRVLNVKTFAVLDSGAGISIATKEIWQKWGALALKKTRMELQLADGNLEHPLGLLVDMPVESCGVTYEHTFAVVDFGRDTNYDVILGRPFMRQMEVIQDWGSDYLYLRHDGVTTRVSLFDHTYRDVVRNPIDDFDSFSSGLSPPEVDSSGYLENAWLFQEPTKKALVENQYLTDKALQEEDYMPHPFPDYLLDDHEWIHILAALDTCTIRTGPQFCDDDDHSIIPIQMVNLRKYIPDLEEVNLVRECISVTDLSSSEDSVHSSGGDESGYENDDPWFDDDKDIVPETEIEKVRMLLRGREAIELEVTSPELSHVRQKQRETRKKKQGRSKGRKRMPEFSNQTEFLFHVEASDCIKAHNKWKTTLHSLQSKGKDQDMKTRKTRRGRWKAAQTRVKSIPSQKETNLKSHETSETSKMSWTERKTAFKDCKQMLNKSMQSWSDSDSSSSSEEEDAISVPSNFKRYTIEDRKIKLQTPQRIKPQQFGESYDGTRGCQAN